MQIIHIILKYSSLHDWIKDFIVRYTIAVFWNIVNRSLKINTLNITINMVEQC